jgi:filamentous hemagglutinin family protein
VAKALFPIFQISLGILGSLYLSSDISLAQVTSDGTVNTQVTQNGNVAEITGGETRGGNLFHSFRDFSVGSGNEAAFLNANDLANIFSRVTGGNISNIDGLIRSNGSANLFLINPAGILFGENARLDVGGSFLGSSASSILFEDGEFSAVDNLQQPVLTINAPIGLGFRDDPGDITIRGINTESELIAPESLLRIDSGKNFALLGGNINLDGGKIIAPGGRVELGGLLTTGNILINDEGSLSFPDGIEKADVTLRDFASVNVTAGGGGFINVNAQNLVLSGQSELFAGIAENSGSPNAQAGDITLFFKQID